MTRLTGGRRSFVGTKKMLKTLDTVKGDVRELVEAFWAFRDEIMTQQAVQAAEAQTRPVQARETPAALAPTDDAAENGIGLSGSWVMPAGKDESLHIRWAAEALTIDDVREIPIPDAAELLAAIGHRQRLSIVLLLLKEPATANEIVATLSLGTTGAAYHHLNVLQRTGLVQQVERGVFSITPHRVPVLLTILASLSGRIVMSSQEQQRPATREEAESRSEASDGSTSDTTESR
jgi:DNA-binding transcriptional ArsR family regulator